MHVLFKAALNCILLNLLHCFASVLFCTLLGNGQGLRRLSQKKSHTLRTAV